MTKSGATPRKKGQPFLKIKHGSAVVPIYKGTVRHWTRYTVAFHVNGHRVRRTFGSLPKAKQEAQIVAQKIQDGLSSNNDLNAQQRESYLAAERIIAPFSIPMVAAMDEYARCRRMLGEVPLMSAVQEFLRQTDGVRLGATVSDVVEQFLAAKNQDHLSRSYQSQLSINLGRFAAAFTGQILHIKSGEIDNWLRTLDVSPVTRNSVLRCIRVFFSFAKARNYLPSSGATAAELVPMAKTKDTEAGIFEPDEMAQLLTAASADVVGFLAIGAFAGLRVAEINRLEWSAVDLHRRIITLRPHQAKTASRRIVPISDNLAAWLQLLPRNGRVVINSKIGVEATALAKRLGIKWPHNGLRHSYISYRIALINDAARVALEAGNSPDIIFKHYRELVTEHEAREWFSIMPPDGWSPPASSNRRYCRKQKANV